MSAPTDLTAQEPKKPELDPTKSLRLVKSTLQMASALKHSPEKAFQQAIITGLKMASADPFKDPLVNPLKLAAALKQFGLSALSWAPEVLMATIDKEVNSWTPTQVSDAIESYHKTGMLKTEIPQLIREKIYAIRVIATSDSAQTEWHVFEKVGGAFNDRTAKFGVVEPLSIGECAKTIAIIEDIRPDEYTNEVKAYIAACAHTAGLLTATPVKWIAMCETFLQQFNHDATGEALDPILKTSIAEKVTELRSSTQPLQEVEDNVVSIQAAKLLEIEYMVDDVLH